MDLKKVSKIKPVVTTDCLIDECDELLNKLGSNPNDTETKSKAKRIINKLVKLKQLNTIQKKEIFEQYQIV